MSVKNLDPQDVARWLAEKSVLLVDVREPAEYAAERIPGALLYPLSTFDPTALPASGERKIIFHCGSGMRSAKAVAACRDAGVVIDSHMKGGLQAWKAAGLPVLRADPATGQMHEA